MQDRRPLFLMAPALAWLTAFMVVPCLLILPLALFVIAWTDAHVLPRLYPPFHLTLRAAFVGGCFWTGCLLDDVLGGVARRGRLLVATVVLVVGVGAGEDIGLGYRLE